MRTFPLFHRQPHLADTPRRPMRWGVALAQLLALELCLLVLYREDLKAIVEIWGRDSETYAHGVLVLPIVLWLVWRRRGELAAMRPEADARFLVAMVLVLLLWTSAWLLNVNAARQFSVVGLLVLSVPLILGGEVSKAILFPLLFSFFAVPFGDFMLWPMMDWTADFVVIGLQLTGVPVYREGLQFIIPSGQWSVIEGCSGIRYLMASFMVGSLFAYMNFHSYWRRALFMAVSLALPIVANWVRAYLTVMLGHLSGNRLAVGIDHVVFGWLFFGVIIFVMFLIASRWAQVAEGAVQVLPGSSAVEGEKAPFTNWLHGAAVLAVALAFSSLPQLLVGQELSRKEASGVARLALPDTMGVWTSTQDSPSAWEPIVHNPSALQKQQYSQRSATVALRLALFEGQVSDRKLVTSLHRFVLPQDPKWSQLSTAVRRTKHGPGEASFVAVEILPTTAFAASSRSHLVVWRAYWVDGRFMAGDIEAKLAQAWSRVRGRAYEGAYVVVFSEGASFEAAEAAVRGFVSDNLTQIDAALRSHSETQPSQ